MHITFCGAAQQVTGSCFLFETSASRFLVDCGLFQGPCGELAAAIKSGLGWEARIPADAQRVEIHAAPQ